jgi:hypothetical protein
MPDIKNSLKNRVPTNSFFPRAKNISVANQYHNHIMSHEKIQTLSDPKLQNSTKKKNRVSRKKGRLISISNGGIKTQSARAVGSMDRLARLKALAISGKSNMILKNGKEHPNL